MSSFLKICSDVYLGVKSAPNNNLGEKLFSEGLSFTICLGASGLDKDFCIKISYYMSFFPKIVIGVVKKNH